MAPPLELGEIRDVITAQFPEFAGLEVTRYGAGWDHYLFGVGDEWIVRFPQRDECVEPLRREIAVLSVVSEALGSRAPRFERVGAPGRASPYPFVAYRRLVGIGADQVRSENRSALARDVGLVLEELHRIDPRGLPDPSVVSRRSSWGSLRSTLVARAELARPLIPDELREVVEPYLAGQVREPPEDGPHRFIHGDVCPDHVIVDPLTDRLVGLIDFTDTAVDEIVLDFVGLIGIGGYGFINEAAQHYGLGRGPSFEYKLQWLARTLSLLWLVEAVLDEPRDVPKHVGWVASAFASWPSR